MFGVPTPVEHCVKISRSPVEERYTAGILTLYSFAAGICVRRKAYCERKIGGGNYACGSLFRVGKFWERTPVAYYLLNRTESTSRVFLYVHNPKVVGSNPTPATKLSC